jgi:protoporphyrinogen oxidase
MFHESDEQIMTRYRDDFRALFRMDLQTKWTRLVRVPMYSPVFRVGYRNPPVRSARHTNLFYTGNYRTHPSVASTGTALGSGIATAAAILAEVGGQSHVVSDVREFRFPHRIAA